MYLKELFCDKEPFLGYSTDSFHLCAKPPTLYNLELLCEWLWNYCEVLQEKTDSLTTVLSSLGSAPLRWCHPRLDPRPLPRLPGLELCTQGSWNCGGAGRVGVSTCSPAPCLPQAGNAGLQDPGAQELPPEQTAGRDGGQDTPQQKL